MPFSFKIIALFVLLISQTLSHFQKFTLSAEKAYGIITTSKLDFKTDNDKIVNLKFRALPSDLKNPLSNLTYTICIAKLVKSSQLEEQRARFQKQLQRLSPVYLALKQIINTYFPHSDVDGFSIGKQQYINIDTSNFDQPADKEAQLIIAVRKFDPQELQRQMNFQVQINASPTKICPPCVTGTQDPLLHTTMKCNCIDCQDLHSGYDCSQKFQIVSKKQKFEVSIHQYQRLQLVLPMGDEISLENITEASILLQLGISGGNCLFFMDGSTAPVPTSNFIGHSGVINTVRTRQRISPDNEQKRYEIRLLGNSSEYVSITVENYNPANVKLQLVYFNSLFFSLELQFQVLCVMGILCFGALLLIAVCRLKAMNLLHRQVVGQISNQQQGREDSKLNKEQIARYFPSALLRQLIWEDNYQSNQQMALDDPNTSKSHHTTAFSQHRFNDGPQKRAAQKYKTNQEQCTICIGALQLEDEVKTTYCGHIFHSFCLDGWFQKQTVLLQQSQNCPNCRKEFSIQNIHLLHNQIVKQEVRQLLGGIQLAVLLYNKSQQHMQTEKQMNEQNKQ